MLKRIILALAVLVLSAGTVFADMASDKQLIEAARTGKAGVSEKPHQKRRKRKLQRR